MDITTSPSASTVKVLPQPGPQVFINFRARDHRNNFISHMERLFTEHHINYYINRNEFRSIPTKIVFERIKESKIALAIFSENYADSEWCLDELVEIMKNVKTGNLRVIPVFFNVQPDEVRRQKGEFGVKLYGEGRRNRPKIKEWEEALNSVPSIMGLVLPENGSLDNFVLEIVKGVKKVEAEILSETRGGEIKLEESQKAYMDPSKNSYTETSSGGVKAKSFGIKESLISRFKENVNRDKIRNNLGMIIGCLLLLIFVLQQIASMSTRLIGESGAINRIVDNVPKLPEYIPAEGTEDPRDTYTERSSSDAKTNADLFDRTFTNSLMDGKVKPPQFQVFINFRGDQLRNNFVGFLVDALRRSEINVFIDNLEERGEDLDTLFKRIEDSGIAIVLLSSRYTESNWCLEELVKIKERVHQGLLKVLPIFYKVTPDNVKRLKGEFGEHFRDKEYMYANDEAKIKRWKEAIAYVSRKHALNLDEKSSILEINFVDTIVKAVLRMLQTISKVESGQSLVRRKPS